MKGAEAKRKNKPREQLIRELVEIRQRITKMETLETERKRAQQGMERAAKEWRTTFDAISDLVSIHDKDFKFVRVNKSFAEAFEMEPKELIGKTCYEIVHGTNEPRTNCPHKQVLEDRKPHTAEFLEPHLGIHLEMSASPIFNEKGKIVGTVHITKDVTERKQMEEELRKREASLAEAQRVAHLGNWGWDITNNTLHWSDEIYRIFGLEPQQFGATYEAFLNAVHPDDRAFVQKSVDEALYEKKPYSIEHRIVLPNGLERIVHEKAEVTFDKGGRPVRMIGTVQDITKRKKAEEERKEMEAQLVATDRLVSIGELVSGIAHELNNPLTSIVGFSQLLLEKDVPDEVEEDLKVINREAQRTAGIVRNLLAFARKHEPEKQSVNINGAIKVVLALRGYEQKVHNIQVNTQLASDLPEIMADGFQLQQVFLNIVINAEHFMIEAHKRGTLTITTERVGDIIRASFADDGPGIVKENLGHLFDPFFTTKKVGKGTGLGLSISYGIVAEHGGRIYAESELGKGATFIVELPIGK